MHRNPSDVPGVRVGHATDPLGLTGCTVVMVPQGATCGVDVRGSAPGTRETDLLHPVNAVQQVQAVVLAGGSAFGLAAADGVMQFLASRGIGFATIAGPVPIVPSAVLYDLAIGRADAYPDRSMGYLAAQQAWNSQPGPLPEGNIGAGTGATVGKYFGTSWSTKSGLGYWSEFGPGTGEAGSQTIREPIPGGTEGITGTNRNNGAMIAAEKTRTANLSLDPSISTGFPHGRILVAAAVAVNAFGDVIDAWGRILAGTRQPVCRSGIAADKRPATGLIPPPGLTNQNNAGLQAGRDFGLKPFRSVPWARTAVKLRKLGPPSPSLATIGTCTTLAVVVTNAALDKTGATKVAQMAQNGLARSIDPVHTMHDGDVVFCLSTGSLWESKSEAEKRQPRADITVLGSMAAKVVARAVRRAVIAAHPAGGVPAVRNLDSRALPLTGPR